MAKLTLSFKGLPLGAHPLDAPVLVVGSDPDCGLPIDSLAVAPRHLAIRRDGEQVVATALDPDFPVRHNGRPMERAVLKHGDLLVVGKHTLTYLEREAESLGPDAGPQTAEDEAKALPPGMVAGESTGGVAPRTPAYLQVRNGPRIGEIVVLTRPVSRLGRIGGTDAAVVRRDGRFLLRCLGEANRLAVNGEPLDPDRETPIADGDLVEIDRVRCRFYCPNPDPPMDDTPQPDWLAPAVPWDALPAGEAGLTEDTPEPSV